jgi:hypothetical protein
MDARTTEEAVQPLPAQPREERRRRGRDLALVIVGVGPGLLSGRTGSDDCGHSSADDCDALHGLKPGSFLGNARRRRG